jgi:hypothetical protein
MEDGQRAGKVRGERMLVASRLPDYPMAARNHSPGRSRADHVLAAAPAPAEIIAAIIDLAAARFVAAQRA